MVEETQGRLEALGDEARRAFTAGYFPSAMRIVGVKTRICGRSPGTWRSG